MFTVGLTGGIASGKTTVSKLFAGHQVPVVDTDIISRSLLEPGKLAYDQVVAHFGDRILSTTNAIDRSRLRQIVFSEPDEKTWLETMLHPLIFRHSHDAIIQYSKASYVLAVVPLLLETNFQALVDRILVVDCPPETQIKRLKKRDSIDSALAQKMLSQQMDHAQRLARAQDIIDNRGEDADLVSQVAKLHQTYLELARLQ